MQDVDLRNRLAEVIVEALEVGTGKHEADVLDELFSSFGLDLGAIDGGIPRAATRQTELLRAAAAAQLAEAAPSAEALFSEIVRCGGRFVAMVEEIYRRLARHAATTTGSSESFRLTRDGVDAGSLELSPAFLERIRKLSEVARFVEFGRVAENLIADLLVWDGGECYGTWPLRNFTADTLFADSVLHLAWIRERVRAEPRWAAARTALDAAMAAAERVVAAAERICASHMAQLDALHDVDDIAAAAEVFIGDVDEYAVSVFPGERELWGLRRILAAPVAPGRGFETRAARQEMRHRELRERFD